MINIIVGIGKNGEIGKANGLLWHLSSDLKRFKEITMGHPMIMGRKTYESIGRPLPGRTSIVMTRNPDFRPEGVVVVTGDIREALEVAKKLDDEVFVIGGGGIYQQALPLADRIYLTRVWADFPEADTFFHYPEGFEEFTPEIMGEEEGLRWEFGVIDRAK